jgi:GAF domain-containing protein
VAFSEESMRAVVSLAGLVLGQDDLSSSLHEVTRIAVGALPGCDGASLTSFNDGHPQAAAADGDWARGLDELQYEEREGPCLDATRTGNVFRVRDLAEDTRWPFYAQRAVEAGARSMVSAPMASEGKILGALNIYSRQPDAFGAEDVSLLEIMAAQAGMATQVAASFFRHRDLGDQLRQAMQSRASSSRRRACSWPAAAARRTRRSPCWSTSASRRTASSAWWPSPWSPRPRSTPGTDAAPRAAARFGGSPPGSAGGTPSNPQEHP